MAAPRYGVFLRPDPATCLVQSQINQVMVQQFGIVSAAAFPPHATLVGSMRTEAESDVLIGVLDLALAPIEKFTVYNSGIMSSHGGWAYNINDYPEGEPNKELVGLATVVMTAMKPLALPVDDLHTNMFSPGSFRAHLSLASHDLLVEPRLAGEVGRFLRGLPLAPPAEFVADTVTLFEFTSDGWQEEWWHNLKWRHLRSWLLR